MAMADGGYRPAYNLQFKTDPKTGCVVGIEATNKASDSGQLDAAVDEIERRYAIRPKRVLADGGYVNKDDIEALHDKGIEVFCPPRKRGKLVPAAPDPADPVPAKPGRKEKPGVAAWHERMSQEDSAAIYAERIVCERPHADVRNRGLYRFLVRGMEKVKAVALWHVTAYNFLQIQRLTSQAV